MSARAVDYQKMAARLVDRDAQEVSDACANVGQMVDNLPRRVLVNIVAAWLAEMAS